MNLEHERSKHSHSLPPIIRQSLNQMSTELSKLSLPRTKIVQNYFIISVYRTNGPNRSLVCCRFVWTKSFVVDNKERYRRYSSRNNYPYVLNILDIWVVCSFLSWTHGHIHGSRWGDWFLIWMQEDTLKVQGTDGFWVKRLDRENPESEEVIRQKMYRVFRVVSRWYRANDTKRIEIPNKLSVVHHLSPDEHLRTSVKAKWIKEIWCVCHEKK